jgi:hypothetical protein
MRLPMNCQAGESMELDEGENERDKKEVWRRKNLGYLGRKTG